MNKVIKIAVAGYGGRGHYAYKLMDFLPPHIKLEGASSIEECDVLVFTGGEDINPELYGEKHNSYTGNHHLRDFKEIEDFKRAVELKKMIFGICRGAQLCCALSGGRLIQHVNNHAGRNHPMLFINGEAVMTNSLHHQMMYPFDMNNDDYEILAFSKGISTKQLGENDQQIDLPSNFVEPEVVYFKKTNSFGVQGHPEMMNCDHPAAKVISKYFIRYYNNHYGTEIQYECNNILHQ